MPAMTLDDALAPLLADPSRSAVLLDVDGTLAPIVRHAEDAHVPEVTRAPLIEIARRFGLVACISGRRATAARRIVGLGTITYVGNHGAETLRGGETEPEVSPEVAAWIQRVRAFNERVWAELDLRRLRIRGEDKELIVSFHWRGTPDPAASERAIEQIERLARQDGLVAERGRMVLEVRPDVPFDKGAAVARLLADTDIDSAIYIGDDRTDADAFAELREAVAAGRLEHAVCVGVASDETPPEVRRRADLLVPGTDGVRRVLARLASAEGSYGG